MFIPATQLRNGAVIKYQNDLYRVTDVMHVTPGNWRGMVQTKLRNIRTGLATENRFRSEDKVERITLDQQEMEFLYQDGEDYHFMNTESFEQIVLRKEDLGDSTGFLTPNLRVQVELYDSKAVGVELPKTVDLKVVDAPPGIKTATVTNVLKPAITETGLVVPVPNFIDTGEVIRVDTSSGAYLSRAK
ncbi:MAG: elongation factor [Candidatus Binatota bacterium]|jgi:elongation factor P|nr:elongation factor [Candidatus Binatota bacterium]